MAIRVDGVRPLYVSDYYQTGESELIDDMDTVEEYVRLARENNSDLFRDRKKERELDGAIQGQCGGTVVVFRVRRTRDWSAVVVHEHYEADE